MRYVHLTLTDGNDLYVNTFDIVLVMKYSGRVNTFKTEQVEEFGSDTQFKTIVGDPLYVTNGAVVSIRNKPDLVVKESHTQVMNLINAQDPVEPT